MNKLELKNFLYRLTDTEQAFKNKMVKNLHNNFDKVKTTDGEEIYVFTYEDHHIKMRKKYPNADPYLKDTQIEIIKHARYSITPIHMHSYIEMNYVYSGTVETVINGSKVTLKQGDVCILDENVPHTILETTENDILINFLMSKDYFSTAMLSRLSNNSIIINFLTNALFKTKQHESYIIFNCFDNLKLKETIENILCEYYSPSICSKDIIEAYIIIVFSELLRTYQKQNIHNNKTSRETYIGSILQHIEENYENCTLRSVADHFNYNASYLSRYIKEKTGKNFKNLIQELRFNKACLLLKNTNLPIDVISYRIGYNNLGFFYQKFFEIYKKSPKTYREES